MWIPFALPVWRTTSTGRHYIQHRRRPSGMCLPASKLLRAQPWGHKRCWAATVLQFIKICWDTHPKNAVLESICCSGHSTLSSPSLPQIPTGHPPPSMSSGSLKDSRCPNLTPGELSLHQREDRLLHILFPIHFPASCMGIREPGYRLVL